MKKLAESKLFPHLNVYQAEMPIEVVEKLQGMHSHYQRYAELINFSMWEHCNERSQRAYLIVEHKVPPTGVMASPTLMIVPFNAPHSWATTVIFNNDRVPTTEEVNQVRLLCEEYGIVFEYTPGNWF